VWLISCVFAHILSHDAILDSFGISSENTHELA